MKFSKTLKEKQVQEWRKKYLAYEHLKGLIDQSEECFFGTLDKEIDKVEGFYKVLEKGAERGLSNLLSLFPEEEQAAVYEIAQNQCGTPLIGSAGGRHSRAMPERRKEKVLTQKALESRVLEYYMAVNKIAKYREMNLTGFRKILKKYDKQCRTVFGPDKMESILSRPAFSNTYIYDLMEFTRMLHKRITPKKRHAKAKELVVDLTQADSQGDGKSFFAGMMATCGVICLATGLRESYAFEYVGLGAFDSLLLVFGILLYLCRKNFISYNLILEMNLKPKLKISKYFLLVSGLVMVHGSCAYLGIAWGWAWAVHILVLLLPVNLLMKNFRYYWLRTLFAIFTCSVCGVVRFKHFFIADHLLSLRPLLIWGLNRSESPPSQSLLLLIVVVPVAIRISQCLRRYLSTSRGQPRLHIYNTMKYGLILSADLSGVLVEQTGNLPCIFLLILANGAGYTWDLSVDWMLGRRPKLFRFQTYVGVCLLNGLARVLVVAVFIVKSQKVAVIMPYLPQIGLVLALLELVRRLVWGVIRMEVEHLNNCDQLKAINGPLNDLFYMESAK
ncbi:xenotropic and polytropic retrovirus receptor 1 [Nematocida homosporus]|uniref:xenotropic and polytropic retrovirus receptor 1 n=1 Tax=Nematocida homosporus TaxID=1912981 RepID=UPI00222057C0|nr:xenotropic and polytropic retrovirus receptor 1 [Nematocida homosporus]KAI5186830.1 xenotropic and polytropic retrovirus receptor 1 [Nematocida homosporus]